MTQKPIIIIGGGIAGLSAAIRLAGQGKQVIILEQNDAVGGKMSEITADGFRWDTGPSVITMRHVFEDLFASVGRRLEDYITLLPVDPLTRYFYRDGTVLNVTRDLPDMLHQIEQLEPTDGYGYLRYLTHVAKIHQITGPVFIYDQPPTIKTFLQTPLHHALQIDGLSTMDSSIKRFVKSPQLRQMLMRFATYVGASPYQAPGTLNVIAHVELNGGVWYPQGGIYQIAAGMEKVARELDVEIRLNTAVSQIIIDEKTNTAMAVQTADGQTIEAEAIIANVDVTTVYQKLLSQHKPVQTKATKMGKADTSCSGFILLWGVEGETSELAHHNIFFSQDYKNEFKQIFKDEKMPDDPTIYVAITSKSDAEHAPEDHENWFVLVNAPSLGKTWDWEARKEEYRDHVIAMLAEHGVDLDGRIVREQLLTPIDLEQNTGAFRGALYGRSSNDRMAAFKRPHNRCKDVSRLYFAGGTTHPGGGVPMVTLSGKVAAELVLEDI